MRFSSRNGYAWLSHFAPCAVPITHEGMTADCVEKIYLASCFSAAGEHAVAEEILAAATALEARKKASKEVFVAGKLEELKVMYGSKFKPGCRTLPHGYVNAGTLQAMASAIYERAKAAFFKRNLELMLRLDYRKFATNTDLRAKLLATGDRPLHELHSGHTTTIWHEHGGDMAGRILTIARSALRAGRSEDEAAAGAAPLYAIAKAADEANKQRRAESRQQRAQAGADAARADAIAAAQRAAAAAGALAVPVRAAAAGGPLAGAGGAAVGGASAALVAANGSAGLSKPLALSINA